MGEDEVVHPIVREPPESVFYVYIDQSQPPVFQAAKFAMDRAWRASQNLRGRRLYISVQHREHRLRVTATMTEQEVRGLWAQAASTLGQSQGIAAKARIEVANGADVLLPEDSIPDNVALANEAMERVYPSEERAYYFENQRLQKSLNESLEREGEAQRRLGEAEQQVAGLKERCDAAEKRDAAMRGHLDSISKMGPNAIIYGRTQEGKRDERALQPVEAWLRSACGTGERDPTPEEVEEFIERVKGYTAIQHGVAGVVEREGPEALLNDLNPFKVYLSAADAVDREAWAGMLTEDDAEDIARFCAHITSLGDPTQAHDEKRRLVDLIQGARSGSSGLPKEAEAALSGLDLDAATAALESLILQKDAWDGARRLMAKAEQEDSADAGLRQAIATCPKGGTLHLIVLADRGKGHSTYTSRRSFLGEAAKRLLDHLTPAGDLMEGLDKVAQAFGALGITVTYDLCYSRGV